MLQSHGLGGSSDLPIPAELAIAGGCAALAVSFVVLLLAWRKPRFSTPGASFVGERVASENDTVAADAGVPVPAGLARIVDGRAFPVALRVLGMAMLLYIAWAAIFGPDTLINPTFGVVFVLLWVGIVPASLLFGPAYRAINPARTLALLAIRATAPRRDLDDSHSVEDRGTRERETQGGGLLGRMPRRLGYWPAALGLFAFVWLELVYPGAGYLGTVRLWFAFYFVIVVFGAVLYGSRWVARADPFEVYSTLVGHLSVWARRPDGTLVTVSPLRNLARLRGEPGLVAVVAILLGSTAFDSFSNWNVWLRFSQSTELNVTMVNTGVLVAMCAVVGVLFAVATTATGIEATTRRWELPGVFAHSVVPIIVGYMVAHYLTLLVETGQQTLLQLSDPMANGANLLGTANWQINYWISNNPSFLAITKVVAIVCGHVLGVIAAHDRALAVLPHRHRLTGQLPLLLVMVTYTFSGLFLLFGS